MDRHNIALIAIEEKLVKKTVVKIETHNFTAKIWILIETKKILELYLNSNNSKH